MVRKRSPAPIQTMGRHEDEGRHLHCLLRGYNMNLVGIKRRFYINTVHNWCPGDYGYMMVSIANKYCDHEKGSTPYVFAYTFDGTGPGKWAGNTLKVNELRIYGIVGNAPGKRYLRIS